MYGGTQLRSCLVPAAPATRSLRAERRKGRRRRAPPSPSRRLRRSARSTWESIFQHILEIQLQQAGLLRKILLDPPSASARYLVTIPLVTPPIIAGSSRRVNSASHAWSDQLR